MKCGVWSVLLCLCLSVSMSVSVWEGGCSWLCEVTGRHGNNFLPFSGRLLNFSGHTQHSLTMPAPPPLHRCPHQPPAAIPPMLSTLLSPFKLVPGFRPLFSGMLHACPPLGGARFESAWTHLAANQIAA